MFETDLNLFVILLGVIVIAIFIKGVKVVPQAEVWVIERLGKYNRSLEGGLNVIIPFVDAVRKKYMLQEQLIDIRPQQAFTRDNVSISIDGVVFLRVVDAVQATYGVLNLGSMIAQLAQTTLRAEIGKMDLDDTLSSRDSLNAALLTALDSASAQWGAKVTRVEISEIRVPEEVQRAMELQLQATRERRAIETKAEADKNAVIAEAEGQRQKAFKEAEALERTAEAQRYEQEQLAEGQRNAMEMINVTMASNPQAAEFLLAQQRIEAFAKLAESESSNKVIIPTDAVAALGSLSVLGDLLKATK
jgi:regulator of protease activity HflC (stomatin/prohibitin superfamily)